MSGVSISALIKKMNLKLLTTEINTDKIKLYHPDVNRPALQLAGYYKSFDHDRLQVIGRVEHGYLCSLSETARREALYNLFSYRVPCLIICKGQEIFPEMIEYGREFDVPVFRTEQLTTDFTAELLLWLREELADRVMMHGVPTGKIWRRPLQKDTLLSS